MKKTILSFAALFIAVHSWGHPPAEMTLRYDEATQTLYIEVVHVSSSMREHYVRKLLIYKNDEEVLSPTIPRQTTPTSVVESFPFKAASDDVIRVKALCKEGGSIERILIVSPEASEESPATDKGISSKEIPKQESKGTYGYER